MIRVNNAVSQALWCCLTQSGIELSIIVCQSLSLRAHHSTSLTTQSPISAVPTVRVPGAAMSGVR
jgi:hypothetical protein